MKYHPEELSIVILSRAKDLMIQGAVTPVKHRVVYPERSRGVAFRSSVVLLLNR